MILKTEKEVNSILRSIERVFKNNDINKLTKGAYNFLYISCGFIAHYNIHGFREQYRNVKKLRMVLLKHQHMNQWSNFRPEEPDYAYMMQKRDIYNKICEIAAQSE